MSYETYGCPEVPIEPRVFAELLKLMWRYPRMRYKTLMKRLAEQERLSVIAFVQTHPRSQDAFQCGKDALKYNEIWHAYMRILSQWMDLPTGIVDAEES